MSLAHSPTILSQSWAMPTLDPRLKTELHQLLSTFLLSCKVEDKSPRTLEAYSDRVGAFIRFLTAQNIELISQITSSHVRYFMLSLQERRVAPSTANAYYRAINRFFNWLVDEGIIEKTPMQNIKAPRIPKLIVKPFSQQDIQNILLLCSGNTFLAVRNKAIILVLLDTGLRLSELAGIQLKDWDFTKETIRVLGKGSKERMVRVGKVTQKALLRYLLMRHDTYSCLWVSEGRKPLRREGIQIAVKRLSHRAGVTDAKPGIHTWRHTFATTAIRNGANVFYVQSLLGHSTLTMTRRYASTIDSEEAVKSHPQFSPVDHYLK